MSLAINYFHHNREFFQLNKFFWNNLPDHFKNHFHINILSRECYRPYFEKELKDCNFAANTYYFHNGFNYREKLQFCINQPEEYSIKMDEDCFVPTKSWEAILSEYETILNKKHTQLFTIMLSNGVPIVDYFIDFFCTDEERERLLDIFSQVRFDKSCNGINPYGDDSYLPLNKYTVDNSAGWDIEGFYEEVEKIPHSYKGIHPVRFSTEGQIEINKIILDNVERFQKTPIGKIYSGPIDRPYLCNGFFGIKTSKWKDILARRLGSNAFDEIALNEERWENKESVELLYVWAAHLFYNTVPDHLKLEKIYYEQLVEEIIN